MSLKLKPSLNAILDLPCDRAVKTKSSNTTGVCESSWRRRADGSLKLKWRLSIPIDRVAPKG
jgi:hypothetical protein